MLSTNFMGHKSVTLEFFGQQIVMRKEWNRMCRDGQLVSDSAISCCIIASTR